VRDAGILLPLPASPPCRIVLVDVAGDRYLLALLVARTGVAVAHRRLGPSSSATISTTCRALPSSAVQVRCWSRPTTTTRPVDPEVVFGRVRRRAFTPEEFGHFLAGCPAFYRDHFVVQVGTGLRSGELLGLRARRVDQAARRIEVVEVRYDAGRFGSGYKDRPKSDASIRPVPMAEPVAAAVARRLAGCGPNELVFCGPVAATASHAGRGRGCRPATTAGCTGWRRPGPSCRTWTCTAPTTCATPSRPGWRTAASRLG
jgi:integrase